MIKRFVIAAIIVALFLGGIGYFQFVMKPKFIGEFMAKMVPPAATVTTEKAKTATWADQVHSIGTMLAIQGVDVAPEVGGVVVNYFFDSGQDVEKGAKLVELDTSVEQAELKVDQAVLEVANLEYDRQSKLVGKGAISQSTLDTTISKRDAAAAAVQKNLAHIAHKNITAPFAGRLGLRRVERGQYVSIGQALVWLQALDPIWIDFPVSENELGRLKPKAAIELTVAAFPGEVFKGEIEAFDARVNQDTRQLMVRVGSRIRSGNCCPECSPTWRSWPASRRLWSRCRARRSLTDFTATASGWRKKRKSRDPLSLQARARRWRRAAPRKRS